MHMVKSTRNNIKITEPADYYLFRALCKVGGDLTGIWYILIYEG